MDLRKIKALIEAVTEGEIDELEVESKEGTVRIRKHSRVKEDATPYVVMSNPALPVQDGPPMIPASIEKVTDPVSVLAADDEDSSSDADWVVVTSPIVGTFYESLSPGASPLVEVGDIVKTGQILCIIEAMKLMNEIESEVDGVIVKRFVSNSQPVEYGEKLFAVKPST